MDIKTATHELIEGNDLSESLMRGAFQEIMSGQADDAQIGGFLVALRIKGETTLEIREAAKVMRELSTKVEVDFPTLDIVGTGGDGAKIFNVSTASCFVASAAGAKVAKHGNRSITSSSGMADVLEAAGINLALSPKQIARCIDKTGLGFMFAVNHHKSMKHAIGPRKSLSVRTIFNQLGPLTNPAGSHHQVIGVYDEALCLPFAEVLRELGSEHALVVSSNDGLDELSIADETKVVELKAGEIIQYSVSPEQFNLHRAPLDSLRVDSAEESLKLIKKALKGEGNPASDMIALNAGAAIYAADITLTFAQGVEMAQDIMVSGLAVEKMKDFVEFTRFVKA